MTKLTQPFNTGKSIIDYDNDANILKITIPLCGGHSMLGHLAELELMGMMPIPENTNAHFIVKPTGKYKPMDGAELDFEYERSIVLEHYKFKSFKLDIL